MFMIRSEKLLALWLSSVNGNQLDFATLHKELYPRLFHGSLRMIQDEDVVNDLLQDLFVKFWETRDKIGDIRNVEAYFYRSARSRVLNYIRLTKNREARLEQMDFCETGQSVEDAILLKELGTQLTKTLATAMDSLPVKQKEILKMRFYDDMAYAEIAETMGIRYQSVINHVYRATQSLKQLPGLSDVYAA